MKKILFGALILICSTVQAEGVYDGIWQSEGIGYFSVHEKQGTIIVARLSGEGQLWEAYSGTISGNTSTIKTLVSDVEAVLNVTWTSETTFSATQVSCVELMSGSCFLPDGFTFTGHKIW
ncbi:MAG: hypothetical protein KAJ63_04815 [Methyloprofundus sp.]|nr:hypothetical protein [Methyloprofundus sp.]